MAEWDTAYINDLPDSAFAVILPGGEKDDEGKTTPRSLRKLPHHNAGGSVDMAHLRNAMSREPQADMPESMHAKASRHLEAHMAAESKSAAPMKATPIDDDAFRLLALPFGGPIPYPGAPRGVDMDRQWFSEGTDFGAVPARIDVDFHHGGDRKLGRTVIGKAGDLEWEDDGGWVTVWLDRQQRKLNLVRRLAERGAQLFGSSEAIAGSGRLRPPGKADVVAWSSLLPGEIVRWHYIRQTISPDPINTLSVLRPMKATFDDLSAGALAPTTAFFDDLARFMDDLASRPATDPTGEVAAKAGRVLAARNEARLREALAAMQSVLEELDQYVHTNEEHHA